MLFPFSIFAKGLAIDLGTVNTLISVEDEGVIIEEPSVVSVKNDGRGGKKIVAVGEEARQMIGKTPDDILAIRPMRDGVIADFEATEGMLRYFIKKANRHRIAIVRPRIVIAVPHGITPVEKKAVQEAAASAGGRSVHLIEEPMASAIGIGLPVEEPVGNMVVDIGGGTTEIAVISLGGIVVGESIRVGGVKFDMAITQYVKNKYGIQIGERTAENVKIELGSDGKDSTIDIKGLNLATGTPSIVKVPKKDIKKAIIPAINEIITAILDVLEKTPAELAADIVDRGIFLTGGGSLIDQMDELIKEKTELPVVRGEEPLHSVVNGAAATLKQVSLLKNVSFI